MSSVQRQRRKSAMGRRFTYLALVVPTCSIVGCAQSSANLDPCVVGTWHANSHIITTSFRGSAVPLQGGENYILRIDSGGGWNADYRTAEPYRGMAQGSALQLQLEGTAIARVTTTGSSLFLSSLDDSNAKFDIRWANDDLGLAPVVPSANLSFTYTCSPTSLVVIQGDQVVAFGKP